MKPPVRGDIYREMTQRMVQLDTAARHPRMVFAFEFNRCIAGNLVTRLVDFLSRHAHQARHDIGLRLGAAFGEAAIGQQLVNALLRDFGF